MTAQIELRSRHATSSLLREIRDPKPYSLRRMQSRSVISMTFDNAIYGLKYCFDRFVVDGMAALTAGILTPRQARSVSIYLTAFILALLMLGVCRELNLYCFRSVAHDVTASAPKADAAHDMISSNGKTSAL